MNLYVIVRKGPQDFLAGMLDGICKTQPVNGTIFLTGTSIDVEGLAWKPYKKIDGQEDIKLEKADEHFLTLKDFCEKVFPNTKYSIIAVEKFTKKLITFTKARQIWVHKKSEL